MNWTFHLLKGTEVRDGSKVTLRVKEVYKTSIKENKIVRVHVMTSKRGGEMLSHPFLTLALDGRKWTT